MHISDLIDVYISPSKFLKSKCEEMGFKGKIIYLPNFVRVEDYVPQYGWEENYIVYFGRLSEEKGLFTLIEAVKDIPGITLKIIGEGPLKESLELKVESLKLNNVKLLGYKTGHELKEEIKKAMFVVCPSEWYENNPRSIIESFALGKCAIGARIGGIPELVRDNETGLTFEPGSVDDLRSKITHLLENSFKIQQMGKNARRFVEEEINQEYHYEKLMQIYNASITKLNNGYH
jgi:glycosyltransferase involved in cell wall biosynthesis